MRLEFAPRGELEDIERPATEPGAGPAESLAEFMVRAGRCEAAAAGAFRAMTLRFSTLEEGVAMRPCRFDAPK